MQIRQINSNNFNGRMILKSKDARFINLLNDIDFSILKKVKNPHARFYAVATSTKTDGYWQGMLLTGKDVQTPYTVAENKLPSKVISSITDILEIPVFKNFSQQIQELYKNFSCNSSAVLY